MIMIAVKCSVRTICADSAGHGPSNGGDKQYTLNKKTRKKQKQIKVHLKRSNNRKFCPVGTICLKIRFYSSFKKFVGKFVGSMTILGSVPVSFLQLGTRYSVPC